MALKVGDSHNLTVKLRLKDKYCFELNRQAQAINFVWNYCNQTQKKAAQDCRTWLNYYDFARLTAGSCKLLKISSSSVQSTCRIFDQVRKRSKKAWLRWRGKKSLGWIPFTTGDIHFDGVCFTYRGKTFVAMHHSAKLFCGIKIWSGSFNQDSRGRWYINLVVKVDCSLVASVNKIGIDLGLKNLATLSDGRKIETPQFYRKSEAKLAKAQRAKKTKRTKNIHAKIANRRRDFLHKVSTKLVKEYGLIIIGDVSSTDLLRTSMAKSVADAGWADFKRMLSYKAIMHGGSTLEVSEYRTTQTCSCCGSRDSNERPKGIAGLGIREWTCSECGTIHDRDINAAKNILRSGLATLVAGTPSKYIGE
jgi:putative transposase